MKKSRLEERREFVKETINSAPKVSEAVKDLSNNLFLSERTIWEDYKS